MASKRENIPLIINSSKRLNTSASISDLNYSINYKIDRVESILIDYISIPYSFYSINSLNNELDITYSSTPYTITVTPGNYTSATIVSALNTALQAINVNFLVTYTYQTNKLTITNTSSFTIHGTTSSINKVLGFTIDTTSTTHTGNQVLNLSGNNYLLIKSEFLTKDIVTQVRYADNTYSNILCVVPINTSFGGIITSDNKITITYPSKKKILTTDIIDFEIQDESGNTIDLNGIDWALHLLCLTK